MQAWLGAHPTEDELHLWEPATRARLLRSITQVLDDGFDGIHYDFEPVEDGEPHLLAILRETRPVTRARGALLSVSAIHIEPFPGPAALLSTLGLPLSPRLVLAEHRPGTGPGRVTSGVGGPSSSPGAGQGRAPVSSRR